MKRSALLGWSIALIVVCLLAFLLFKPILGSVQHYIEQAIHWIDRLGFWGPIAFIFIYIISAIFLLPGSLLTASAGTLFGTTMGIIYVSIASTIGATLSFLIGRYFARCWVEKKIANHKKFAAIDTAVEKQSWKIVGLTRLSPIIPFSLLNYGLGLTKVKLSHYIIASWIGMIPGTILFVYIGSLGKQAINPESKSAAEWFFYIIGFIATIAITLVITRISQASLEEELNKESV